MEALPAALCLVAALATNARASAQTLAGARRSNTLDVGATYAYLHSNAPSGEYGCFSGSGGTASFLYTPKQPLGFVADFTLVRASSLLGSTENMTLFTYTFGPRYHFSIHRLGRARPFLEALFGGAHTSSDLTYADGANGAAAVAGVASIFF